MKILEELKKFVLTVIAADLGRDSIDPDEDLLEQGIIDSLGVMTLTTFMEDTFGIQVSDEDIVPENFQSLNVLAAFVEQKMGQKLVSAEA
jgi:acyl carrier protein